MFTLRLSPPDWAGFFRRVTAAIEEEDDVEGRLARPGESLGDWSSLAAVLYDPKSRALHIATRTGPVRVDDVASVFVEEDGDGLSRILVADDTTARWTLQFRNPVFVRRVAW